MERFVEVCRRRGLKCRKEEGDGVKWGGGLRCGIRVDGARLEQVSEFKYLGCFE